MSSDSTGEKIKEKVMGSKDKVKETVMGSKDKVKETVTGSKDKVKETVTGSKDKVKETVGMGGSRGDEAKKEELGPGAATRLEEEVAKTSSDSPTKKVEGPGKALGKEEGAT